MIDRPQTGKTTFLSIEIVDSFGIYLAQSQANQSNGITHQAENACITFITVICLKRDF